MYVRAGTGSARRWLLAGLGAVLLAGVAALAVVLPRGQTPDVPVPSTSQLLPLKGTIDILIYEPDNQRRQNVYLDDAGAMPLRPGDEFCIEAELNRPAYVYVLWIDTDGKVQPVYPWRPGHWEERPAEDRPMARLRRPEALDEFYKVRKGTAGMETLALLARDTPLSGDVDLRAELGVLPRPAVQELKATAWFENGVPVRNRRGREGMFGVTRARGPGGDEPAADQGAAQRAALRLHAGGQFCQPGAVKQLTPARKDAQSITHCSTLVQGPS